MDNATDYKTTWTNFNAWSSFDATAAIELPAIGGNAQGITPWNSKAGFPSMQGQAAGVLDGLQRRADLRLDLPTRRRVHRRHRRNGSTFMAA